MMTNFAKFVGLEVPSASPRFNGQFIELDVVSVVEAKERREARRQKFIPSGDHF